MMKVNDPHMQREEELIEEQNDRSKAGIRKIAILDKSNIF